MFEPSLRERGRNRDVRTSRIVADYTITSGHFAVNRLLPNPSLCELCRLPSVSLLYHVILAGIGKRFREIRLSVPIDK